MSVHVTLGLGPGGPVAIKTATEAGSIDRLRHEAARLRRAGHPGVVEVVSCGPVGQAVELRTRYAGDALAGWSGTLARAAGLSAAVATTLADLHDSGVVHGRLDASHVLVGGDGRPRLCGFSHPGDAQPADDVRALGALLDELMARADAGRRSSLGRPFGSGGDRRALAQVVARAHDPVPSRRPSARALAHSILAAVPGAELPPPSAPPPTPGGADGLGPWLRPARAWPPAPVERLVAGSATADDTDPLPDRPAAATTAGPTDTGTPDRVTADSDAADTGPTDTGAPDRQADHGAADTGTADDSGPTDTGIADQQADHGAEGVGQRPSEPAWPDPGRLGARPWPDEDDHDDFLATAPVRPVAGRSPIPRLGETRLAGPAAGRFGDRLGAARRRDRRRRAGRGAAVCVGSACVVGLTLVAGGAVASRGDPADGDTTPAASSPSAAAGPARPAACPAPALPAADIDGDGCPEPVRVDGRIVEVGDAQWALGEPGDVAAVGDWDCDGSASPALLRPATGDVFVFPRWSDEGERLTVDALDSVGGGATAVRARRATGGCDDLVVEAPAGDVVIEVER